MSKFQAYLFVASLSTLLKENRMCLTNLLLMIPTAAGEQLLETLAFQCPKDRNLAKISSMLFLFLPVIFLLIIGMAVDMRFWYVCHGRRNRNEKDQENISCCSIFLPTLYRSLAVPFIWLFVALLDGTYVVCFWAEEPDELTEATVFIQAVSHWLAWSLLSLMVVIGTGVTCWGRWSDNNTFLLNLYYETYKQKMVEGTDIRQKAAELAAEEAINYVERNLLVQPENGRNRRSNENNHTDNVFELDSGIDETGNGQRKTNNYSSSKAADLQQKGDNAETPSINKMAKPGTSDSTINQNTSNEYAKTSSIENDVTRGRNQGEEV